jgi:hypothetical protein
MVEDALAKGSGLLVATTSRTARLFAAESSAGITG